MRLKDPIAQAQLDRRAKILRKLIPEAQIRPGWITYIRKVLGISLSNLAKRAGVSKPTVAQAERREADGKVTLGTLKKMAHAMECDFVYAFVPKKEVKALLRDQAMKKANEILQRADTHMLLEDQRVKTSSKERLERIAEQLLEKGDVW